tara:strand:- start:28229 stop:28393 length:165 start_codon:yes stop_codon:yes gene_type:complete
MHDTSAQAAYKQKQEELLASIVASTTNQVEISKQMLEVLKKLESRITNLENKRP